jgi:hypothetical protein
MTTYTWKPIAGTPHYDCGPLVALYAGTYRPGLAAYNTYLKTLPARLRTPGRALSVGGLPTSETIVRMLRQHGVDAEMAGGGS